MFLPDVVSLRQFYTTPLGESARALLLASIERLWPDATGDAVLGIGYTIPYAESYLKQGRPFVICMPAQQGAVYWPASGNNRVFMAHESELPLQDNSVNRILLVHCMENSEQLSWMMHELWRVLTPGGRVMAVVPSRLGFWSRSSRSPFGYGRPFSMTQLRDLFTTNHFTPTRTSSALFVPPTHFQFIWRIAPKIEKIGKMLFGFLGGVLIIEAEKQVYASIKQPVTTKAGYRVPIPAAKPAMSHNHN